MKHLVFPILFFSMSIVFAQVTNSFPDDGNVGIGTTSPTSKLTVKGHVNIGDDGNYHLKTRHVDGKAINNTNVDDLYLNYNTGKHVRIGFGSTNPLSNLYVGGNVGIGTTSPQYMVHAKKSTGISEVRTESYDHYARMGTNDGGGYLGASNGNGELTINIRGYGDAYFNAGNVGIGTTSPDSKLTVKGNIHAEEVKVDLSVPGPDYVFNEGYDLKSLGEVQNYIEEHGHLPNIPSAKEMEENGVQLGEMNMKLLEKIEELTLYTLEQEEKLQDCKVQLAIERRVNKEQEGRLSKLEELLIEK